MFNLRQTGWEANGRVWWNSLRPVHGGLFILFGFNAIRGKNYSQLLLIDVLLGIFSQAYYRSYLQPSHKQIQI